MEELLEVISSFLEGTSISLNIVEYDDKTIAEKERDNLIDLIFEDLGLSYDKKHLAFNGAGVIAYLKAVYPNRYEKKLETLKNEQTD